MSVGIRKNRKVSNSLYRSELRESARIHTPDLDYEILSLRRAIRETTIGRASLIITLIARQREYNSRRPWKGRKSY